ncbi:hypothetical protein KSP40_PGU009557 [Platanthera guangdongensis]|uniref:Uncharacterized protein n=1 Tax=Platanthera guangdongensis TaxID=2320717 RepID=A0ABR2LNK3_9ASPA
MICGSIYNKDIRYHGIQHFSIKSSNIFGSKSSTIPSGLSFFLSSGRSLHSVRFADVHMGQKSAVGIFEALIESPSGLASFEMSGNELEGWLSKVGNRYNHFSPVSEPHIALQSLVRLNLRGNNLNESDMSGLHHMLVNMPKLLSLDLSDNPIGDDGLRSLMPFFVKDLGKTSRATEIWLENCDLSGIGVSELLQSLAMMKCQLKTLSFASNDLGRVVARVEMSLGGGLHSARVQ